MHKIIIKGKSGPCYSEKLDDTIDGKICKNVDCQDNFVEYMDKPLSSKLKHGYMSFDIENNGLITVVEYEAKEELTKSELEELTQYTSGQLSDGIGEGFEQYPCMETDEYGEIYISPWFYGQELIVIQNKIDE